MGPEFGDNIGDFGDLNRSNSMLFEDLRGMD